MDLRRYILRKEKTAVNIVWMRRDLRLDDNTALYHALKTRENVLLLYIFNPDQIERTEFKPEARINFIYDTLKELKGILENIGSSLCVQYGNPVEVFRRLLTQYHICSVYTNREYEPYTTYLDLYVERFLKSNKIEFFSYRDHVLFEKSELVKNDGKPYTVFTAYKKKFLEKFNNEMVRTLNTAPFFHNFIRTKPLPMLSHNDLNVERLNLGFRSKKLSKSMLQEYAASRDYPAKKGTSGLSAHIRYGTISIRKVTAEALLYSDAFFSELIWRNFFSQILWFYPYVATRSFKPAYDNVSWEVDKEKFDKWCQGRTGFPMVDAGMRELNETGFMHNRLRMITASFLCKHLMIDWRWGESYFAGKLIDYDLASNNGGWQWCAGTGCDAVPYFRIFNPDLQATKFDPDFIYIRKWIPEFGTAAYPSKIVEHKFARQRALERYSTGLGLEW